jgi:hypothetical protein
MDAHAAVPEALLQRHETRLERAIEISTRDGMAVPLHHERGRETRRYGLAHASIYPYRPYVCGCGGVVIVVIQQASEWGRFGTEVLQRKDLFANERFVINAWRVANRDALDAGIEPIFAALDHEEVIRQLTTSQSKLTEVRSLAVTPLCGECPFDCRTVLRFSCRAPPAVRSQAGSRRRYRRWARTHDWRLRGRRASLPNSRAKRRSIRPPIPIFSAHIQRASHPL